MSKENSNVPAKMLFIAATHGNEGFSIPVLKKLEVEYPKNNWSYDWIVGNPQALAKNTRYIEADLNRSAPGNLNAPTYEERRAVEIMNEVQDFDVVVDIHGTESPCGLVKIICLATIENLCLAALFPDLINIIWYSSQSSTSGPLTQFTKRPGIEIECDMNDEATTEKLYQTLAKALVINQSLGWLQLITTLSDQEWFQVVGKQTMADSDPEAQELQPLETAEGTRYPFLSNQYRESQIFCYLLEKINIEAKLLSY